MKVVCLGATATLTPRVFFRFRGRSPGPRRGIWQGRFGQLVRPRSASALLGQSSRTVSAHATPTRYPSPAQREIANHRHTFQRETPGGGIPYWKPAMSTPPANRRYLRANGIRESTVRSIGTTDLAARL